MLDRYTKDMLFTNILNVYSDAEQLDIIEYLVKLLKENNEIYMEENSIEEVYVKGLEKVLEDIKNLKVKEHDFLLDN
jgi:uncharacterized protein (DUF927 family)